jgi:hypothetical protein
MNAKRMPCPLCGNKTKMPIWGDGIAVGSTYAKPSKRHLRADASIGPYNDP